jgi:hypothetical protein
MRSASDGLFILEAGRLLHGLERMSQMKFAILERDGTCTGWEVNYRSDLWPAS